MFHSQKTCTNSSRESEKIAKTRVCIARLCSVFSKLVTCLSISLGVKSVLITRYVFLHCPRFVSLGAQRPPVTSVTPVSALAVSCSSPLIPGGVSDTLMCLAGPWRRHPCIPLPSPGFPSYLLSKCILLRIGHLLPRCCFSRLLRKVHASAEPQLLSPRVGAGLWSESFLNFSLGTPCPRPCCLPLGLMKGERSFQHLPHVTLRRPHTILLPLLPPNRSPQTANSCRWTHLRPVRFARPDLTYLNQHVGSRLDGAVRIGNWFENSIPERVN